MHKLIRKIAIWWFKKRGWRFSGHIADFQPKTVIVSNRYSRWGDFWIAIAVLTLTGIRSYMLVDRKYFVPGLGAVLRSLSCRPYDFRHPEQEHAHFVELFHSRKRQTVLFSFRFRPGTGGEFHPEFYDLAEELKIPIIMIGIDGPRRHVKIHSAFLPGISRERDLEYCRKFLLLQ